MEARRSSRSVAEARRDERVAMVSEAVCLRGALSIVWVSRWWWGGSDWAWHWWHWWH